MSALLYSKISIIKNNNKRQVLTPDFGPDFQDGSWAGPHDLKLSSGPAHIISGLGTLGHGPGLGPLGWAMRLGVFDEA